MPNQFTNAEEALSSAHAARVAALPGRWSRTRLSRRQHFVLGGRHVTLCGIEKPYPNGLGWTEVDLRVVCSRCIRLLPTLCPEPSGPAEAPAGVAPTSSLGS